MAKYYKFIYNSGYGGTKESAVFKFDNDISEDEVREAFDDWYTQMMTCSGSFKEISEDEAENEGITEDLSDE